MTPKIFITFLVLSSLLVSCNKKSIDINSSSKSSTSFSISDSEKSVSASDDFSDLKKKKDESCDTTEDLEKKIEAKAKKQEAFQLQGGDPGCATE